MSITEELVLLKAMIATIEQLDAEFIKTATERPSDIDALLEIFRCRKKTMAALGNFAISRSE